MIKINLLPKEMRKKKRVPIFDRTFIYGILIIVGEVILFYIASLSQQTTVAELDSEIATVQLKLEKYKEKITLLNEAEGLKKELTARMNAVQELENKRAFWVQVLTEFRSVIPEYVWVDRFEEKSTGLLNCLGRGYTLKAIAAFLINLLASEIFTDVEIGPITQQKIGDGTGYSFSITTKLKTTGIKTTLGKFVVDSTKADEAQGGGYKGFVASTRSKFGLYSKEDAKKMMGGM